MNTYKFNEITEDKNSTLSEPISKEIKINEERWGWGVVYKDETELHQFGNDGWFHQFKDINWPEVKLFVMYKPLDMSKRFDLVIGDNMKVFHFYRNIVMNHGTPEERSARAYVFGFENKKTGEKTFNFILPDDRVIQSNRDDIDLVKFNI